jgi:hypothetical protein
MTSKKLCNVCKINPSRNQKRGGYCTQCNNEYGRANYKANKERYFKQAKGRDKQLDELIIKHKSKPCADCDIQYPPYVMDFDHLDGETKEFGISYMRRHRMAFDKIEAEIAKCEVVCANCHRERTNQRNPARYTQKSPGAT